MNIHEVNKRLNTGAKLTASLEEDVLDFVKECLAYNYSVSGQWKELILGKLENKLDQFYDQVY